MPAHVKIKGSQFIFKDKLTGAKARLVVRGDQQFLKPTKDKTYSQTPSATKFCILCSLATEWGWAIHSCDVVQAFTQSNSLKRGDELYIHPPVGYNCAPGTIWKLRKPLYRLSIAPKAWFDTLREFLVGFGFINVNKSDTSFRYISPEGEEIHLIFHVDDLLFSFSHKDLGLHFKAALLSHFNTTDDGPVQRFI